MWKNFSIIVIIFTIISISVDKCGAQQGNGAQQGKTNTSTQQQVKPRGVTPVLHNSPSRQKIPSNPIRPVNIKTKPPTQRNATFVEAQLWNKGRTALIKRASIPKLSGKDRSRAEMKNKNFAGQYRYKRENPGKIVPDAFKSPQRHLVPDLTDKFKESGILEGNRMTNKERNQQVADRPAFRFKELEKEDERLGGDEKTEQDADSEWIEADEARINHLSNPFRSAPSAIASEAPPFVPSLTDNLKEAGILEGDKKMKRKKIEQAADPEWIEDDDDDDEEYLEKTSRLESIKCTPDWLLVCNRRKTPEECEEYCEKWHLGHFK